MRMGMVVATLVAMGVAANVMAADVAPACTAWNRTSAPHNGRASALVSVDALDAANVWTVGHEWDTATTRQGAPLAARWAGSTWTDEPIPDLSHLGAQPMLAAVDIAPAGDPWVVGRLTESGGRSIPLILQFRAGFWRAHDVVMLDSFVPSHGALRDVAAIAENDAWAIGQAETIVSGRVEPFAAHWDGNAWSEVPFPAAADRNRTVAAVSAAAADAVWAVGYDFDGDHTKTATARIFRWNGGDWRAVDHPAASKPGAVLLDIVALSANDVWAVGVIGDEEAGLFLHWDGSAWTSHVAPPLSNPQSVDGSASGDVWAVGSTGRSQWDGKRWTFFPSSATDRTPRRASVAVAGPCEAWTVSSWGVSSDSASQVERLGAPAPAPAPPPTPVDLTATAASIQEIALPWKSGADPTGAIGDANYVIERRIGEAVTLGQDGPAPVPAPVPVPEPSSADVVPVPEPEPLQYAIRPAPPATPRNFAATGTGAREIALSWAPLDATSGIGTLAFVVERCAGEADECLTRLTVVAQRGGKATTFVDSGLSSGAAYTYWIFAVNEAGKSAPSAPATAFTLRPDSPSPLPEPIVSSVPRS